MIFYRYYQRYLEGKSDSRIDDMTLMKSPVPTVFICLLYMYFCKVLGPRIMKNRPPMKLNIVVIFYNLLQMTLNSWIFYKYFQSWWMDHNGPSCHSYCNNNSITMRLVDTYWWYYLSKFTQLFDSVIFILRKRFDRVSTLHVVHHGIMPISVWVGMKVAPGGHNILFVLVNSLVHALMYFYYSLSSMGPMVKRFLWWGQHTASLQILQIIIIMTQQLQVLFSDCKYPRCWMLWFGIHMIMFMSLFFNFFKTRYGPDLLTCAARDACFPVHDQEDGNFRVLPDVVAKACKLAGENDNSISFGSHDRISTRHKSCDLNISRTEQYFQQ